MNCDWTKLRSTRTRFDKANNTKKVCLMWSLGSWTRPWSLGAGKREGENGSGKQYLDRQVARTKTKAGVREWTTNTHVCHEQGQKKRDEVRGIPIDEKGTKGTKDTITAAGGEIERETERLTIEK